GGNDVCHPNHRHIFDGACRSFGDRCSQADAAPFWNDDAVGACCLGGSNDGSQIVWVLNVVTDDNKGRLVAGFLEDVLHGGKIMAGSHGSDSLCTTPSRKLSRLQAPALRLGL